MMLRLFTNTADVTDLHAADFAELESIARSLEPAPSVALPPADTIPSAFLEAYAAQVDQLSRTMRFNAQLNSDVAMLTSRLFPSARTEGKGPKPVRDLVISVHVRLGDKKGEIKHVSPLRYIPSGWAKARKINLKGVLYPWQNRSALQTVDVFVRAAQRAKDLLISEGLATAGDGTEKATLVVVSDDPHTAGMFREHPSASQWTIVGTNEVPLIRKMAIKRAKPLANGFNESAWNGLSPEDRDRRARAFVRDLGFVAQKSDAVVLTPTSNVGRLLSVMVGARFQEALGGQAGIAEARRRIWSADARWFPTGPSPSRLRVMVYSLAARRTIFLTRNRTHPSHFA